ncbi:ESX secretion-associated protein EspG [Amycolatopsis sp. EV170708-02-1]|nr:ESX secretion-associated protein EspG [Amycolatopsis sp. EV170708-02-1]UMP02449.1 ESX secretion-associated protein EspG [Amycolatopsis sp. EV170708-02-1]
MPASFSMSMAQLDVVLEDLGLGRFVLPFEIPTVGTTITERERHCEEIWAGLADRGFARGRELLRDYEQSLRLWATGDFVVTMEAHEVEQDAEYLYRGAWNSRLGIVSEQRGFDILFEPVYPEQVVATLLGYLPSLQPFPGRVTTSSTLPRPNDRTTPSTKTRTTSAWARPPASSNTRSRDWARSASPCATTGANRSRRASSGSTAFRAASCSPPTASPTAKSAARSPRRVALTWHDGSTTWSKPPASAARDPRRKAAFGVVSADIVI